MQCGVHCVRMNVKRLLIGLCYFVYQFDVGNVDYFNGLKLFDSGVC